MRYLILGAGGMAGHIIANYLIEQGENVEAISRRELQFCKTHVLDITEFDKLKKIVENNYDYIINCVGILNKSAEEQVDLAIQINSYLPHFLSKITKNLSTSVIHLSTDCVFSGTRGNYKEIDFPDGETYYDRTKALGELIDDKNLTFRNSIIGPDINENGIGLFNWFMKQNEKIYGYEKSIWSGVTTLTLAKAIHQASYEKLTGLYHLTNNSKINKYELLKLIDFYTGHNLKIQKVNGVSHDKSIRNTRTDFSFIVPSYETQIKEMVEWVNNHKNLYMHYFN